MTKLTPWFPPHIKPVRVGVYPIKCDAKMFAKWDGLRWSAAAFTTTPDQWYFGSFAAQGKSWRGLTKETK